VCAWLCAITLTHAQDSDAGPAAAPPVPPAAATAPAQPVPPAANAAESAESEGTSSAVDAARPQAPAKRYQPVVVGRATPSPRRTTSDEGPMVWSPHREKPARKAIVDERWFVELGVGIAPRHEDAFTRRLGYLYKSENSTQVGPQVALGAAVHRNLTIVGRYDLLGLNKYDGYRWHTHGISGGLRGVLPLSSLFQLFGEVDLGLALARVEVTPPAPIVPDGVDVPTPEKVYSQELSPLVRAAGGLTVGGERFGLYVAATYVYATPLRAFDAVHNDGGPGFSGGLRLRGSQW
jgi:hypothetical protein